ncbi:hypothetical protein P879_02812 [Paragonimus westermani]|uniref:RRM domain-containing protein n=1 Tax=Paragonimus westermani TaxID=34504 RepID=A0A8T0DJZ0_9TREM|nr:hypothetical protein P879_02812 [Paragonimus westermani]
MRSTQANNEDHLGGRTSHDTLTSTAQTSSSVLNTSASSCATLDHWSATLLAAQALVRTKKVFVGGVATGTTAEELEAFFSEFGKVS